MGERGKREGVSVVAGVSLLDGVLIGADCRITYDGTPPTYRDELQKLIPIGSHTAIGLTGDIRTAAELLLKIKKAQQGRIETVELEQWLPRFLEHEFPKINSPQSVTFLVASVIPSRPNAVPKADIMKIVFDAFATQEQGVKYLSQTFTDVINAKHDRVAVEGAGEGHLFAMQSPKFTPVHVKPMRSIAIGSGGKLQQQLIELGDKIHFDSFGENKDVFWFGRSLVHYLRVSQEPSVGGMFLIIKIDARHGMRWFPHTRVDITNKDSFELIQQGTEHRWVQRKLSTGEAIELMLPWEVDDKDKSDNRFDHIRPLPMPKA
jgi:hypothetical protein